MKHFFTKLLHVRTAMMLLLTTVLTLTAQTAWADVWTDAGGTGGSGTDNDPYYVNMPAKDAATTIENAAQLNVPNDVTTFKLYDNGGKDGYYSNKYTGYLVITAPTGCVINISGSINIEKNYDKLTVWSGTDTSDDSKKLLDGVSSTTDYQWTDITTVTSTGNVITVYFNSDDGGNRLGLDLTVKIENPYDLEDATITGVNSLNLYSGSPVSITPTVQDASGTTLTLGTHYTATLNGSSVTSFPLSLDKGDYTLTVTGISPYTGSQSKKFYVYQNYDGLSVDTDYNPDEDGFYYVNMPAKDAATTIENAAQLNLSSSDITTFKLYDDGGKDGYYSDSYTGYLVITAPTGYVINLSGSITTEIISSDKLTVWSGTDTTDDSKKLINEACSTTSGTAIDISPVTSTGNVITVYFNSDSSINRAGFDLTVTIIPIDTHDLQNATVSGVNSSYLYTGSAISITPTVKDASGTTLTLGTHYTAALNGSPVTNFPFTVTDEGDYTLTVTGMGDYTGSQSVSFTVSDCPAGLSIDHDYNKGQDGYYYVNMPVNGGSSTTQAYQTLTLPGDFTSAFKVYDDGGKGSNYSNGCNGYLIINAPSGYWIQVSGTVKTESSSTDYLTVYDGDYNSGHPGNLGDYKYGGFDGSNPVSIGTLTTTGNAMTLFFRSSKEGNTDTGLNLTVTLVDSSKDYDVNLQQTSGGTIASSKTKAKKGETVTLTATPADGYVLSGISVTGHNSGNAVDVEWNYFTNSASFVMNMEAVDVTPTFTNDLTNLSVGIPLNGHRYATIPAGATSVNVYGETDSNNPNATFNGTLTLTAKDNYCVQLTSGVINIGQNNCLSIYNGTTTEGDKLCEDISGQKLIVESDNITSTNKSLTLHLNAFGGISSDGITITATAIDAVTEHTVTVNNPDPANGCTVTADKTSAKVNETVTLTVSTATGYQLDGISVDKISNNYSQTLTKVDDTHYTFKMPSGDVTVTPTFSLISYTVTLNATGETDKASISGTTEGKAYVGDAISLTADEGYSLSGVTVTYGDNQSVTVTKVSDAKYTFTMPAANVTVSATVSGNAYTVAFDKNATDATGTMDPQAFIYGTAQNLTANAFTREGYTFMGWNTQADGNGTTYTDEQEVNNLTTEAGATVTLYAQWTFESWPGSGNENDPYLISSREALNELASKVNNGTTYINEYFKVTADINYTGAPMSYDDGNSNYVAIGDKDHLFRGNFDGDGHTIRGIRINKNANYQGLFGYMGAAVVKNVVLADTRITIGSSNYYAGGIAGRTTKIGSYNTIENCHVGSDVYIIGQTGGSYGSDIGGIVGENSGYVCNCTSAATVSGNENVGAIMGYHAQMSMENCLVLNATVSGTKRAGAIVGFMSATALEHNYYLPNGNVKGVGYNKNYDSPFDFTNNDGAVPGYLVTVGEGVTASTPALTLDVPGPGMTVAQTYRVFKEGQTVTLGHTERDGYIFGSYVVKDADNNAVTVTETSGVYTFVMPAKNVTADAEWTSNGNITWTLENGVLTISGTGPMDDYGWTWDDNTSPFYEKRNEITSVVITEGVTHIGDRAFIWCSKITSVSIPASVETIGESVFLNCTGITEFTVDANNNNFTSDGGLLYNKTKTSLLNFPPAKTGSVTIPGTVTSLAASTFNSAKISALDLSACTSLTTIENSLCYNCSNLQTVTLPASIKVIKSQAFRECGSLQSINLNACTGLTKIGDTSFDGCASLEGSYTLPATLTCISSSSFTNCAKLTKLTLTSVENFADDPDDYYDSNGFGSGAFDGCTSLTLELPEATTLAIMAADGHTWKEYLDIISLPSSFTGMTFVRDGHTIKAQLDGNANTTVAIPADVKLSDIILTRTFSADQVSTWMMPFATRVSIYNSKDYKFYTFSGVEYNEETGKWVATMTQLEGNAVAQANTPYLVKGGDNPELCKLSGESYFTLNTTTNDKKTVVGNWTFKGTYEEKTWTDADVNDYGFAANNATGVTAGDFVHLVSGAHIKPMRSYLTYTGTDDPWAAAGARGANRAANGLPQSITVILVDADGSTTEIDAAEVGIEFDSSDWYDLSGRKLIGKPTKKGMYIHNGRTVVVK